MASALADVGAFTGHVRTGDQLDTAVFGAEHAVVGDEFAFGHSMIEDRVATFVDFEDRFFGDCWADVLMFDREFGE